MAKQDLHFSSAFTAHRLFACNLALMSMWLKHRQTTYIGAVFMGNI
jgi:hypothetical protein